MNYFTFRFSSLLLAVLLLGGVAQAQLTGTVTVPSGTYPDLASVITALNAQGVGAGGVIVNITASNPQTAPVAGYCLGGATSQLNSGTNATSATRTITINGNNNTVSSYTGISNTSDAFFRIIGVDYVTVNALNLQEVAGATGILSGMEFGYQLAKRNKVLPFDGVQHVTINNCTINFIAANIQGTGIAMINADTSAVQLFTPSATVNDANSFNTFSGNTIVNCSRGVYMQGIPNAQFGGTSTNIALDVNNAATGNNITIIAGAPAYGVFTSQDSSVTITGNIIQSTSSFAGGAYGVEVQVGRGDVTINNNTITLKTIIAGSGGAASLFGIHLANTRIELKGKLNINGNTFADWTYPTAAGSAINVIYNQGSTFDSVNVKNNMINGIIFGNGTAGFSFGNFYGIYNDCGNNATANTGITMSGNTVKNVTINSGSGSVNQLYVFYNLTGSFGSGVLSTINVLNNVANNISATSVNNFNVFNLSSADVNKTFSVKNNKIDGITAGAFSTFQGFFANASTNNCEMANDTVINVTTINGNLMAVSTSSVGNFQLHNCFISNLVTTSGVLYGYRHQSSAASLNIYSNNFNGFSNIGTSGNIFATQILGPGFGTGPSLNFYNNFISGFSVATGYNVSTSGSTFGINGLYLSGTSTPAGNSQVYNNTININSLTTTGTDLGATGIYYESGFNLDLRNNIINVNVTPKGAGFTAAVRRGTGTAGTAPTNFAVTSNGNVYYAPAVANSYLYAEGGTNPLVNTFSASDPGFNTPCGLYKKFMAPADQGSFTENNLVAGTLPNTFVPTGLSFAKNIGVGTTAPAVTTDYAGVTRPAAPDAGALQFTGTAAGSSAPVIVYKQLPLGAYCTGTTGAPALTATITAANGLNITAGTAPRIYYKKSTDKDTFGVYPGDNTSAFNGWKYVEATGTTPTFTFTILYNKLRTAVAVGDSITYFVVAQDNTPSVPNTTVNRAAFPSTYCALGVNLAPGAGPLLSTVKPYGYKVIAPVFAAQSVHSAVCIGNKTVLSVTPALPAGATIAWQQDSGTGTYKNITGAIASTYTTPALSANNNYRAVITLCGGPVNTSSASVTVIEPMVTSTVPGLTCGTGVVKLVAKGPAGSTFKWYDAVNGGNLLYTGDTLTTPPINANTDFYVSASSGNGSETVPTPTSGLLRSPNNSWNGNTVNAYGAVGEFFTVTKPVTINSVKMYLSSSTFDNIDISIWITNTTTSTTQMSANSTHIALDTAVGTYIIPVNLQLQPGTYFMSATSSAGNYSTAYTPNGVYPYNSLNGAVSITGGGLISGINQAYFYNFYDWSIAAPCESPRTAVTASIDSVTAIITPPSGPTGFCQNDSLTLFANTNINYTYQWLHDDTAITGATTSFYAAKATGSYSVFITDALNCNDTSNAIDIIVNPLPTPVITATGTYHEILDAGAYATYAWSKDGQFIPGETSQTYTATANGVYSVKVTDTNSCAGVAYDTVTGIPNTGISKMASNNNVRIYPNPAANTVYIAAPFAVNITVASIEGKELIRKDNATSVNISNLADGIYMVRITDQSGTLVRVEKIVKSNL